MLHPVFVIIFVQQELYQESRNLPQFEVYSVDHHWSFVVNSKDQ